MKTLKKINIEMVLPFIVAWFFMSVLVDIVTIPTVFRNSTSIIDAGKIGMTVFGRFNIFEIIFGLITLGGSVLMAKEMRNRKWLIFAVPLLVMAFVYKFYMTPMITNTTYEIHQTDPASPMYATLQEKHALYHNSYRKLEYVKLILLLGFGGVVLAERVRSNKEIA